MANSYTQFSGLIELKTQPETSWVEDIIATLDAIANDGYDLEDETQRADFDDRYSYREVCQEIIENDPRYYGSASIQENNLFLCHEGETGDPEQAARFIQAFLGRFRPAKTCQLGWAEWCDKPLADAFVGGVLLISADDIFSTLNYRTLDEMADKYKTKKRQDPSTTIKFDDIRNIG